MKPKAAFLPGILLSVWLLLCGCEAASRPEAPQGSRVVGGNNIPQPSPRPGPWTNPLNVSGVVQEEGNYCWAACGEMIMAFVGQVRIPQCWQATNHFKLANCCNEDDLQRLLCDQTGDPDFVDWGFSCRTNKGGGLPWPTITSEIDEGRPFAFIQASDGGSDPHMLVVIGYNEVANNQSVTCLYPLYHRLPDVRMLPLAEYQGQSGVSNLVDYYDVRVREGQPQ